MSLTWNTTKVANFESLNPGITKSMVMMTTVICIGDWTEFNMHEVQARINAYEMVEGHQIVTVNEDKTTTPVFLAPLARDYIGLRTNANVMKRREWFKILNDNYRHILKYDEMVAQYQKRGWQVIANEGGNSFVLTNGAPDDSKWVYNTENFATEKSVWVNVIQNRLLDN